MTDFALLVIFPVSLSEQVLGLIHLLPYVIVYTALSDSGRLHSFCLVWLKEELWNAFSLNGIVAKTWYVNNYSVIQRKYNLWKCKYLWNICIFSLNNHALGERAALFWYEYWYCWHLLVDNAAQCNLKTNKNPLYYRNHHCTKQIGWG